MYTVNKTLAPEKIYGVYAHLSQSLAVLLHTSVSTFELKIAVFYLQASMQYRNVKIIFRYFAISKFLKELSIVGQTFSSAQIKRTLEQRQMLKKRKLV